MKCNKFRTINPVSTFSKQFYVLCRKLQYNKFEQHFTKPQYGFRNNLDIREALFCTNDFLQKCSDLNKVVYKLFLNFNKAFNTTRLEKLMTILNNFSLYIQPIRGRPIVLFGNVCCNQKHKIKISEEFMVTKSVHHARHLLFDDNYRITLKLFLIFLELEYFNL